MLIYAPLMSLDGFTADRDGRFDWAMPSPEVHAAVNALLHDCGVQLFGRRTWEVMAAWQELGLEPDDPTEIIEFGRGWRAAEKVVYSSTLEPPAVPRTRLEREFAPDAVAALVARAGARGSDVSIGGPTLAAAAFAAELVDEVHAFTSPVTVGGGLAAFPTGARVDLEEVESRAFANGTVHTRYRVRR